MNETKIVAAVLAGGKSSRMGRDKGLMLFRDKPLVQYVLNSLTAAGLPVVVVSSNTAYNKFGFPVISDSISDKGPIGGLFTACEKINAENILLISCDMPLITTEVIAELAGAVDSHEVVAACAGNRVNPLLAVYKSQLKEVIHKRILSGRLKMLDLIESVNHKILNFDKYLAQNRQLFINVNSPSDFDLINKNGKSNN